MDALDPLEAERFHDAADSYLEDTGVSNPTYELIPKMLLHTGMRNQECGHMWGRWRETQGGKLQIRIPDHDGCCVGSGVQGKSEGNDPCYNCGEKQNRERWEPKYPCSARPIPVPEKWERPHSQEEESLDLRSLIEAYFSLNDYIGLGAGAVRVRVYEIADHAGLGETRGYKDTVSHGRVPDLDAHTLRHTYGTNLARQGLEAAAIRDLMGHNSITTSNDYISYIGRRAADQLHNRY